MFLSPAGETFPQKVHVFEPRLHVICLIKPPENSDSLLLGFQEVFMTASRERENFWGFVDMWKHC